MGVSLIPCKEFTEKQGFQLLDSLFLSYFFSQNGSAPNHTLTTETKLALAFRERVIHFFDYQGGNSNNKPQRLVHLEAH